MAQVCELGVGEDVDIANERLSGPSQTQNKEPLENGPIPRHPNSRHRGLRQNKVPRTRDQSWVKLLCLVNSLGWLAG